MFTRKNKTSDIVDGNFSSSTNSRIDIGSAKYPLALKIPIVAFILTITTAIIIGTTFYVESSELVLQKRLKDVEANNKLLSVLINNFYEELNSDVFFLYATSPIQGIIESTTHDKNEELVVWKEGLETIFSTMLYSNPDYTSIRFIGVNDKGKEITRVDRHGHKVIHTPETGLQQKGGRDFFKTAIEYDKDSVYFSDVGLNYEFGKVSKPHRPVLNASVPVYDNYTGKVFGVVVISADYTKLISKLLHSVASDSHLYLANHSGDFILHPNRNKEFGFDLGRSFKIQDEFTFLSKVITDDTQSFTIAEFDTEMHKDSVGNYSIVSFDNIDNRHPTRLLLISDDKAYLKSIAGVRYRSLMLELALAIIASIFAIFASRRFVAPLSRMTKSVQQYDKTGDVSDLPIESDDEIGILARAFYNTLEIANERDADAKSANARIVGILESAADAIITIDVKGNILSFNSAAKVIFGYSEEEVLGENIKILMLAPYHDEHDGYLSDCMQTGKASIIGSSRDVQALRKNGEVFPIELSISEVKTEKEPLFTGVIRDVSERKLAEETLVNYAQDLEGKGLELELLRQRADAANDARGEFLANMSHEIRTPMNGIIGTCSLIRETKLTKKQSAYIDTVTKSSEALLHIINDILDFSKIEAGQLDFENIPFDLAALMQETTDVMRVNAASEVDMKLSYPDSMPCYVYGDPGRVRQVLFNLISNASKFTSKGHVDITLESVIENNGKHEFTISVSDSGIGIPEDKIDHIFRKFGQAEEDTTRKFGGTGLGLSICSELIRIMGGDITVDSVIGEGTKITFSMFLGLSSKDEIGGVDETVLNVENLKFKDVQILLADDNFVNMAILTEMLEQYGCLVTPAVNGKEVVAIEGENKFDLVFMDCRMPEMDGYDATRLIRKREELDGTSHTTIVALTANAMKGDREICIDAGMDDYMTKPIKKEVLVNILLKYLQNKRVD